MKGFVTVLVVLGLVAYVGAQPVYQNSEVGRLAKLAQQWEDRSGDLLWKWTYDVYVWFTERSTSERDVHAPPKGAAYRKGLRVEICKRGQQVVVSGEFPTFGLPPSLASLLAKNYSQRFGAKRVHLSTEPIGGTVDTLCVFTDKLAIEYSVPRSTPPPVPQSGDAVPPPPLLPVQIWSSSTECRRQRNLSGVGEQTLFMTVLSLDNPLRMYTSEWQVETTTPQTVILRSTSPPGWANSTIRMVIQRDSGRLLRYEILSGTPVMPDVWQIQRFTTYSGMVVPSYVTRKRVVPFDNLWMHILYRFSLKSVSKAAGCDFHLPLGNTVVDYRLIDNVTFENHVEPNVQQHAVQYRWSGSVPEEAALKRMAYEQGKLPSAGKGLRATWALFVPGVLLLVLAIYFYRRMRQTM
ncbi:MAG: hypothetical protein KatS3mg023_3335 [Armatimonadota bacterium]|nr:MAG: hypothetical protein KatS3mg023_3335 [Armatimonadota bacterium]